MNSLSLTLKSWQSAFIFLLLLCLCASPVRAGQWEFVDYYWSGSADSVTLSWSRDDDGSYTTKTQKETRIARNKLGGYGFFVTPSWAEIKTSGYRLYGNFVSQKGIPKASAKVGYSIYARIHWRRNTLWHYDETTGNSWQYSDPTDNPPAYIYVRELGSVSARTGIYQGDGNPTGYSAVRPWMSEYFEITGGAMGVQLGERFRPQLWHFGSWQYGPNSKTVIRKIAVSGDSAVVPSRTFAGEIKLSPGYEKEIPDQRASAFLGFAYEAEPLNFSLNASVAAVANRKQTDSSTEEIDALVQLRWLYPEDGGTNQNGEFGLTPDRGWLKNQWNGFVSNTFGDGGLDDSAPLPYFQGVADFSVAATRSDGRTPIFDSQIYNWTPKDNTDPFSPAGKDKPVFQAPSASQRTYIWQFGSATDNESSFPKSSSVTIEVKSDDPNDNTSGSLTATKKINWYTTWSPTETGLQKNVVTPQFEWLTLPDGSPINAVNVKPGDTILCFVQGDAGFSTDGGRLEKIRPVPHDNQVPGPGERIEPRVVGSVEPTSSGDPIIVFKSTPQVNPDDDPDAAGFDEIQQTREIAAATEQTYQTGKALVKGALEIQLEIAKAVATGPAEVLALQSAIKGVVAVGRYAESAKELRAGIKLVEKGAEDARAAARAAEALKARGGLSASQVARVEKDIAYFNKRAAECDQIVKDSKSAISVGERYSAETLARIKNANPSGSWKVEGRFVAEDIEKRILDTAGVYASNPTAQPISQALNAQGKVISKSAQGEFMYVLTRDGKLIMGTRNRLPGESVGRFSHPTLIGGKDPEVAAAGMFSLKGGKIEWVDNASGHFQPNDKSLVSVADAFMKLPASARGSEFKVIPWNVPH